jgi:hypothetical protein
MPHFPRILLVAAAVAGAGGFWAVTEARESDFATFAKSLGGKMDSEMSGKKASRSTMAVFSSKDHGAKKYVRNPKLWCADLVPQLTGCAVWKPPLDYVGERYGGVMITPRHILFCKHAHPAWDGGWLKVQPQIIRFVRADNKVVDMKLIANVDSPKADLCVGLLDEDVPEGIHVAPLMPDMSPDQRGELSRLFVPDLSISQAGTRPNGESNEAIIYVGGNLDPKDQASNALRKPWSYEVYPGDSGTPRFYLTPKGLALYQLTGASEVSGNIGHIKELIKACDESAVARGVLKKATGKLPKIMDVTIPAK